MCVNPLYPGTYLPPQPCVVREEGIQKAYKQCRGETLAFTADDEKGVRCWVKGREITVRGIGGRPRAGWNFEALRRVLDAHAIIPRMSVDEPGEISSVDLFVRGRGGVQIFISMPEGRTIIINAELSDTIENIKAKIQSQQNISANQQQFIYSGKTLQDSLTLSDYNIDELSTLHLTMRAVPQSVQNVTLSTNTLANETTIIDAGREDTIENIKTKIQKKEGAPREQQQRIYSGKILQDSLTLSDYNIDELSTLHLTMRAVPQSVQNVTLSIHTLANETTVIDAGLDDTIGNIKAKIQKKEGTPREQQQLILAGEQLEDQKTLGFYIQKTFKDAPIAEKYILHLMEKKFKKPEQDHQSFLKTFSKLIICIFAAIVIIAGVKRFGK